jgi:hypothetical protein
VQVVNYQTFSSANTALPNSCILVFFNAFMVGEGRFEENTLRKKPLERLSKTPSATADAKNVGLLTEHS